MSIRWKGNELSFQELPLLFWRERYSISQGRSQASRGHMFSKKTPNDLSSCYLLQIHKRKLVQTTYTFFPSNNSGMGKESTGWFVFLSEGDRREGLIDVDEFMRDINKADNQNLFFPGSWWQKGIGLRWVLKGIWGETWFFFLHRGSLR